MDPRIWCWLLRHKRPVDSDDALFRKALQRFWKNQVSRFPAFLKANYPEIGSPFALQDCHHTGFLDLRLQVAVSGRLLPQRIDLRLTALFDYLGEARCFDLEEFHCESLDTCRRSDAACQKRSPPENYGKEDHTTVAAFLPWRDL